MWKVAFLMLMFSGLVLIPVTVVQANPPATWQSVTLAEYPAGQATESRICSAGLGCFVVCWRDSNGQVCTRSHGWEGLGPLVVHGPGKDPVVFGDLSGFYLAYSSGNQIVVCRQNLDADWQPPAFLESGLGAPTHHSDFCHAPGYFLHCLTWREGDRVMFCAEQTGGWAAPEIAAADASANVYPGQQVEESGIPRTPRVYYENAAYQIVYRERTAPGVWSAPVSWPAADPDISWPFRVTVNGYPGLHAMVHLGVPRPCFCNEIYLTCETSSGVWSPPQCFTVDGAANNFPQHLSIWTDENGNAHCFWYQSFYDEALNPVGERMYYRVFEPGGYSYEPWTFDDAVGIYNDLGWGQCADCGTGPDFCWIERRPEGGSRVVALLCTNGGLSLPPLRLDAGLTVIPNPAREGSTIAWSRPQSEPARVEIFDAAGRTVRTFCVTAADAPRVTWDGRMGNGAPAPAGSYLVRLVTSAGSASRTVIRIR